MVVSCLWVLETKPGPLQEQDVLFTTAPLIQPLPTHFYLHICIILNWTLADPSTLKHLIFV